MTVLGTALTPGATKMLLLGAGELGKEVAIEAQRYGIEVIAVDRYENAPAMHVAHSSHVIDMLDGEALKQLIRKEKPHYIVPEIEAIATEALIELEAEGFCVVPTARATRLTMDREGIRRLAAEELQVPTSPYQFADSLDDVKRAVAELGLPCVIKPVMSSSGKGQSVIRTESEIERAWQYAQSGGRTGRATRVIVEGFVDFDYEITLLTVRHAGGTSFCAPIGHRQVDGDYRESWQPQPMSDVALSQAQDIARKITDALGGHGIFGVEFFVKDDQAIFSEVSPRPHDTGMVTLTSQNMSEFALHVRAILGLPIPAIRQQTPAASHVILAEGHSQNIKFAGFEEALSEPFTGVRLFGKPEVNGRRRVGVALAKAGDIESARAKAQRVAENIKVILD
ncbi:MAG: formate-dependent phosphoribosylglycinamide formyltransferase [Gammaproteobacteria bacterium]|nr:MAG: formate-dependent phosphoribosylglycinamide formyltransferase [Gammaproteobacteria bacterium]